MSSIRRSVGISVLAAAAALVPSAALRAADLYWDQNGGTAGTGGTGAWNTSSSFWRSGSSTGTLGAWTDGNTAILGGTAGTLTLGAAISGSITATVTGFTVTTSSTNTLTASTLTANSGVTLAINGGTSGAVLAGTGTTTIAGGGTVSVAGTNRVFAGTFLVTGSGTVLSLAGTNALDSGSSSTGLTAQAGGTIRLGGTNNYRRTLTLGATGQGGGRLELGNNTALARQSGFAINVTGNSRSTIATTSGFAFGIGGGNNGTITVASTGDTDGIDLDYLASWRAATMTKSGAGTLRLGSGYTVNHANDLTTFNNTGTALTVSAGTFLNEGTVKSVTNVNGGTLRTASASGSFDQVNVTSGTFEVSRSSGLFTASLTYASGFKALNLRGGTLRYVGVNTDYSASMGDLSGASTVNTNGQNVTFASALSGTGSLTKSGAGTLTLSGANTYSGGTTISGGTLTGTTDSLQGNIANGAALVFDQSGDGAYSGVISGAGSLAKSGAGTVTLSGLQTFTGALDVSAGALAFTNAGNQTIAGALSGSGSISKSGAGRLTLSGGSSFSGNFEVAEGTLGLVFASDPTSGLAAYDADGASPLTLGLGSLTFGAGTSAKILVNGTPGTVANGTYSLVTLANASLPALASFLAPSSSDAGSAIGVRQSATLAYSGQVLRMTVDGTYPIWTGSADFGWSTAGNWKLASDSTATDFLANDAVVFDDSGAAGTITFAEAVSPASITVTAATNEYTFAAGAGSLAAGALVKSGAAVLRLTGTHSPGSVSLSAGRLAAVTGSLGSGGLALSGGALSAGSTDAAAFSNAVTLSGNAALGDSVDNGALTLSGSVALGSAVRTLEIRSAATLSGILSGAGGLTKTGAGNLTLTGGNTFTGATRVSEGTLSVGAANTAAGYLGATSGITVDSGATLLLLSDNAISGFSGTARTFDVAGTLNAGTFNTNVGALTLSGGELAGTAGASGYGNYNLRGNLSVTADSVISGRFNTAGAARNVTVAAGATLVVSGILTNEGLAAAGTASSLVKLGAGAMRVTGAGTSTGSLTVAQGDVVLSGGNDRLGSGGSLVLGAASTAGRLVLDGVSQTLAGLSTAGLGGSIVGGSATSSTLAVAVASGTATFNGVLGGSGANENNLGLTKSGAGALELGGTSTLSGPILVSGGILRPASSGALGSASSVTLAADSTAQVVIATSGLSFDRSLVIGGGSGGVAGQGALYYSGTTGTATWSGPVEILADIVTGGHFGAASGGTLALTGALTAAAGVPVEFRSGTFVVSGAGSSYSNLYLHSDTTVRLGAADILPSATEIKVGTSGNAAVLDLNGFSQSAGSLANATAAFANTSTGVRNNGASAATLTLTGSTLGGVANTVIRNIATATGVLSISPGTGALSLVLDCGDQMPVIHGTLGVTIGASLSSAEGFTKTGAGNLTLSGNNAGLLGRSDIQGGTLVSTATGSLGSGTIRLSDSSIGASGALLNLQTAAQTQSNDFEVAVSGQIRATNVAATLNGDFVLSDGVTLTLRGLGGGNNRFAVTGNTSLALGASAANLGFNVDSSQTHTYAGAINLGAGTFTKASTARLDLSGSLVAGAIESTGGTFNVASTVTAGGSAGSLVLSGGTNVAFTGGVNAALVSKTGSSQISLQAPSDIDALDIQAGSVVLAGGVQDRLGASSALSLGSAGANGKLILGSAAGASNQTLSALTLNGLGGSIVGGNGSADSVLTLDLDADLSLGTFLGGAGTNENRVALAKSGDGVLTLTAANTFVGGATVSAGTLAIAHLSALGTGVVTVNGGILDLGGLNVANAIVLGGGTLANDSAWTGAITVNGSVTAESINSIDRPSVTITGGTIDLTGVTKDLVVEGGFLTGFGGFLGNVTVKGAVSLDADPSGTVTLQSGGVLDLGGRASTKAISYSGGSLSNAGSYTGDISLVGSTPYSLAAGTFGGGRVVVGDGQSATLGSGYAGPVLLLGSGQLLDASLIGYVGQVTLGSGSSFSLTVAGAGGTLVNRDADFLLQSGSTLRGAGQVGDVTVLAGGTLAPGNSPGTLELANTTLNPGGSYQIEIWRADNPPFGVEAGVDHDTIDVAGTLDLSALSASSRFLIDLISLSADGSTPGNAAVFDPAATYQFTLFSYQGLNLGANASLGDNLSSLFLVDTSAFTDEFGGTVASNLFQVTNDSLGSRIVLGYSPIPEPSTYGLILGGLALAAAALRRRRQAAK